MENTTQKLIALVQMKLGHPEINPASNSAVGRVLGISHTHVKRLISGDGVMSRESFVHTCKFLDLRPEEIVEFTLALDADATEDDGFRKYMLDIAKGFEVSTLQKLRASVVKGSASILLGAAAMLAHVDDARASGKLVFSAHSPAPERGSQVCILCHVVTGLIRRAKALVRSFLNPPALRLRVA